MNEQLKTVETILGIKKELMLKHEWRDYLRKNLMKVNEEIELIQEELNKEVDKTENPFGSAQSAADMLGLQ